jgi:hypothetical protein
MKNQNPKKQTQAQPQAEPQAEPQQPVNESLVKEINRIKKIMLG